MPMHEPNFLRRSRAGQPLGRGRDGERHERASEDEREGFIQAYAEAAEAIPEVTDVRGRDRVSYVEVVTLYRGDPRSFEDRVYDVEAAVMEQFPDIRVEWRLQADDSEPSGPAAASGATVKG